MSDQTTNGDVIPTNGNRSLRLEDARRLTPPVDPAEALRKDLRTAFLQSMTSQDMGDLARKLKEQALAGDHKAMQLLMQLLVAPSPAPAHVGPVLIDQRPGKKQKRRLGVEAIAERQGREVVPPNLREDCARLIKLEGPLTSEVLANRCGVTAYVVEAALSQDGWFEAEAGGRGWGLSGEGWAAVNQMRGDG